MPDMNKTDNIENRKWELLAKYFANEADSNEILEIESWANESEENRQDFIRNKRLSGKIEFYYRSKRFKTANAWEKICPQLIQNEPVRQLQAKKSTISIFLRYAAVILLLAGLGSVGYYLGFKTKNPVIVTQLVSADKQVVREAKLPDGTVVTLNSNTKITYSGQFSGNTREVKIQGEAFFEVVPDPEKPFVITAGHTQIKVLGTSFNVSAYPRSKTVEVVVETGKVQVSEQAQSAKVVLVPGEKATFDNQTSKVEKTVNNDPNFNSWKTQNLVFDKTPLDKVFSDLEKTYHIEIETSDPKIGQLILTAQFNKKPVEFILDVIRLTFNLELTAEEDGHFKLTSRSS